MLDLRLYMLQRLTALIMAPLVIGHIAVMIYAVQGGLTVDEILARTQARLRGFCFMAVLLLPFRFMVPSDCGSLVLNGLASTGAPCSF